MHKYEKYRGDALFTGYAILENKVLVTESNGVVAGIIDASEAGEDVQYRPGILCPGFVNAHVHLELSHLKGKIPEKTGMVSFLLSVMGEREAPAGLIQEAMLQAEAAMMADGIVAAGDICNTAYSFDLKKAGRLRYHNFIEVTGFVPAAAHKRYEAALALLETAPAPASLSPHAPYSVSPGLFALLCSRPQALISMHNQESAAEDAFFREAGGDFLQLYEKLGIDISFFKPAGSSSLQYVLPHFNNTKSILLVHNCHTQKEDIAQLQHITNSHGIGSLHFCICPNANVYIGNPLPDLNMLMQSGFNICLGTDSLASNHQLSIRAELNTLQQHHPQIPLLLLLQWATINGARALQMDDTLGSFEKGKKPGRVWV